MAYYTNIFIVVLDPVGDTKDCPFCGCKHIAVEQCTIVKSSPWYRAKCCYCEAHGGIENTLEDAVNSWNNRKGE